MGGPVVAVKVFVVKVVEVVSRPRPLEPVVPQPGPDCAVDNPGQGHHWVQTYRIWLFYNMHRL